MTQDAVLLNGYRRFYTKYFTKNETLYQKLAKEGQSPKVLAIACSDSRIDPTRLLDEEPGQVFVARNVANIVPPYQFPETGHHGTSATLEFAIKILNVDHIVVLGHSGCAGIKALVDGNDALKKEYSFIANWMSIASEAKKRTLEKCEHNHDHAYSVCEQENIALSIANLLTFPWLKEKVDAGELQLHGWHVSIGDGKLHVLDENGSFAEASIE